MLSLAPQLPGVFGESGLGEAPQPLPPHANLPEPHRGQTRGQSSVAAASAGREGRQSQPGAQYSAFLPKARIKADKTPCAVPSGMYLVGNMLHNGARLPEDLRQLVRGLITQPDTYTRKHGSCPPGQRPSGRALDGEAGVRAPGPSALPTSSVLVRVTRLRLFDHSGCITRSRILGQGR